MGSRHTLSWLGQVLAWLVILGIGAVITIAVLIPRVAGATPYTILTGSMRPRMPPGTLVVVRPIGPSEVAAGMVVTYQLRSGDPTVVTHRVISVGINGRGQRTFVTKGDANPSADPDSVRPVQIKGARWYYVPYLGYLTSQINGKERHIVLVAVVAFLLLYAAYMFGTAALGRRRTGSRA